MGSYIDNIYNQIRVLKEQKFDDSEIDNLLFEVPSEREMPFFIFFFYGILSWILITLVAHFWKGWKFFDIIPLLVSILIGIMLAWLASGEQLRYFFRRYFVRKKNKGLLKEIRHYNQILDNLIVLNQLTAAGSVKPLPEPERVLNALHAMRNDLVRALKTERILRENPQFKPENFSVDLASLQALQVNERSQEYAAILNEALQVGMNVQQEMKELSAH